MIRIWPYPLFLFPSPQRTFHCLYLHRNCKVSSAAELGLLVLEKEAHKTLTPSYLTLYNKLHEGAQSFMKRPTIKLFSSERTPDQNN